MISTRRGIEREVFVVESFSALTAIKEVMAMQLEFVMLNGAQKVNCNSTVQRWSCSFGTEWETETDKSKTTAKKKTKQGKCVCFSKWKFYVTLTIWIFKYAKNSVKSFHSYYVENTKGKI